MAQKLIPNLGFQLVLNKLNLKSCVYKSKGQNNT